MPGPISHLLFAQQLLAKLIIDFPFIKSYESAYELGSLGPDPFYFHQLLGIDRSNRAHAKAFGERLHRQDPRMTIVPMLRYLHQSFEDKNLLFSYVAGYLTHYVLDVMIHPFVFYYSGFDTQGTIHSMPFRADHLRIEHSIDLAFLQEQNLSIATMNVNRLTIEALSIKKIDQLFHQSLHAELGWFTNGIKTFQNLYRLVHDPGRWKRPLIKLIFKKRSFIYGVMHDTSLTPDKFNLVTNSDHASWRHPSTLEVNTASIFDLRDQALLRFKKLLPLLWKIFRTSDVNWQHVTSYFPPVNFDGDPIGLPKLTFASIYKLEDEKDGLGLQETLAAKE